jgi:hypothetical protein
VMARRLYGLLAQFETPDAVDQAVRRARAAGYTRIGTYSPFPLSETHEVLGREGIPVAVIAIAAGIFGACLQYFSQYWMNVLDYPLNVGGRPLHSWPAFIPPTVIVGLLWAAAAALIGMLALCRLPRLHHPLFAVPGFERASVDRFFLCIRADDQRFDEAATREFLDALAPVTVQEVPA